MPKTRIEREDDGALVWNGATLLARYRIGDDIERANCPKPYFHPLRTPRGVEVTGFAPPDHVWHSGLTFAFPRVGTHNLWGGGTYTGPEGGYKDLGDHGRIRHEYWHADEQSADSSAISHSTSWMGQNDEHLLAEARTWKVRINEIGLIIDLETVLRNVTKETIELSTPAQRGRPDGGYGGLFVRLCEDFTVDSIYGGNSPVVESGHPSGTLIVHGAAGDGQKVTLGLSFRHASPGAEKWIYRVEEFAAIGWAVAYDEGLVMPAGGELEFKHRLLIADDHVDRAAVEAVL